jgi:organic radical activating enzyme
MARFHQDEGQRLIYIYEHFYLGEGRQLAPVAFFRFGGCNMQVPVWMVSSAKSILSGCDTVYAVDRERFAKTDSHRECG